MKNKTLKEKLKENQKILALWAADCAEHVLKYFEKRFPEDKRPRNTIKSARLWARGKIKCGEARKAALAAHAAARKCPHFSTAQFAARAAGHAAATAHVAGHAIHAANYTSKTSNAKGISGEREWQYHHLPKSLRPLIKKMAAWKYSITILKKDKIV